MYNFAVAKQRYPRVSIPPHKRRSKARHCDDRHRETPPPSGRTAIALRTSKYDIISNGLCSPTYKYGSGNKKPNFRSHQCLMAGPESAVEAYSDFFLPLPLRILSLSDEDLTMDTPPRTSHQRYTSRSTEATQTRAKKRRKQPLHILSEYIQLINSRYFVFFRRNIVTLHYL